MLQAQIQASMFQYTYNEMLLSEIRGERGEDTSAAAYCAGPAAWVGAISPECLFGIYHQYTILS